MNLLVVGIFVFTLAATRWLVWPGNPWTSNSDPNHRSLHTSRTPNGGGLAIILALFALEVYQRFVGGVFFPNLYVLIGFGLIALVSFCDDRRPVRSSIRFLVHLAAASLMVLSGLQLEFFSLPGLLSEPLALAWFALPVTIIATVWFTNLYNFMDGMDGFCGGMTAFGFGGCAALAWSQGGGNLAFLCAATAAAGSGFLVWNFPPARIFMGDVAAAPLGYLVAVVALWGAKTGFLEVWQTLLVFSPFWVDATATLLRRIAQRDRFWEAHRSHAYQRFAQAGWGHRRTTLGEYGLMSLMIFAAWGFGKVDGTGRAMILVAVSALYFVIWMALRRVEKAWCLREGTEG